MFQRRISIIAATVFAICNCLGPAQQPSHSRSLSSAEIVVDAQGPSIPFPHTWEKMFGSGRANLVMRADYQSD